MLNRRIEAAAAKPTEAELQAMAKAAYDELLAEICTDQRSTPYNAQYHSAANLAFADYYDRLARNGGHMSLLREEEQRLADQGWDEQRITDLRAIVKMRENEGVTRLRDDFIDARLRAAGFEPTDELRWMVQLVLYPAFRDAHLDAEIALRRSLETAQPVLNGAAPITSTTAAASPPVHPGLAPISVVAPAMPGEAAVREDWRSVTPTEAAERLIAYRPALWEHRKQGKRAISQVGEQTLRQIRWAATLLEKSMGGRPLWTTTQDDQKTLDEWFERLPTTYGRAPWHRKPETTLAEICRDAEERIDEGEYEADVIGLQVGTTNKHFRKLGQIHEFMRGQVANVRREEIDQ